MRRGPCTVAGFAAVWRVYRWARARAFGPGGCHESDAAHVVQADPVGCLTPLYTHRVSLPDTPHFAPLVAGYV